MLIQPLSPFSWQSSDEVKISIDMPVPVVSCSKEAANDTSSFGWSDIPCQQEAAPYNSFHVMKTDSLSASSLFVFDQVDANSHLVCGKSSSSNTDTGGSSCRRTHLNSVEYEVEEGTDEVRTDAGVHVSDSSAQISMENNKKNDKKVTFSNVVQVRTHATILGSHPCCRDGMALECGWEHDDVEFIDLELYEARSSKRRLAELHMTLSSRQTRLLEVTGTENLLMLLRHRRTLSHDGGLSSNEYDGHQKGGCLTRGRPSSWCLTADV